MKKNMKEDTPKEKVEKHESFGYAPSILFLIFIAFVIYFSIRN